MRPGAPGPPPLLAFVLTPFFVFISRFDVWQLKNGLQVPCFENVSHCSAAEQAAIIQCVGAARASTRYGRGGQTSYL